MTNTTVRKQSFHSLAPQYPTGVPIRWAACSCTKMSQIGARRWCPTPGGWESLGVPSGTHWFPRRTVGTDKKDPVAASAHYKLYERPIQEQIASSGYKVTRGWCTGCRWHSLNPTTSNTLISELGLLKWGRDKKRNHLEHAGGQCKIPSGLGLRTCSED